MDLHLLDAEPTDEEREALDAFLGPPASGWDGGERDPERDAHTAFGGHAARARRHLLLPAFHAIQSRVGWISEGALNYVCERLSIPPADAYGVASFYALLVHRPATEARPARLRRHRLPLQGGRQAVRGAGAHRRPGLPPRPRRRPHRDSRRRRRVAAEPVPRTLRSGAGGAASRSRARRRWSGLFGQVDAAKAARVLAGDLAREHGTPSAAAASGRARAATAPARERRRSEQPRRLPGTRRLRGAPDGARPRARRHHPRSHRRQAAGSRRRRVPDRPQVGRGGAPAGRARTTSSATPTSPSRARSRTGSSWRATRSAWSRP